MRDMNEMVQAEKVSRGLFTKSFIRFFRGLFMPLCRALKRMGVTPNAVTYVSLFLGMLSGVLFAMDMIYPGLAAGLLMGFADIVDGQLAKEFDATTVFGGVLDSTVDRYNEFFLFAGFAWRYAALGRDVWIIPCVLAFFGSVMTSYVKSRAESSGLECKVGRLQRPERLTILAFGALFGSIGIDVAVAFLAVATQATVFGRLHHVWRQAEGK
jgi:archaetidylinositol phosphate synthase